MICAQVVFIFAGLQAAATPTAGMSVAIVPVAAERVGLEEVPLYERLDDALRAAAVTAGVKLQAVEATRAHLAAVRDSGIDCDFSDALCLAKVAVLADVDRLFVPIARREGTLFHVRMLVVDGGGRSREVGGDVSITDDIAADHASASALIDAGMLAARVEEKVAVVPEPPPDVPPAAIAPAVEQPWVGIAVMGAGGALAVGGAVGVLVIETLLATPEPYEARQGKMAVGQACLVAIAAGAAGAGIGALLFTLDK